MKQSRPAATILEVTVAAVLIASLLSFTVQSVASVGRQRREALRQTVALQILANQMEVVTMRARSIELELGTTELQLDESDAEFLPQLGIVQQVQQSIDEPELLQVTLEIDWETDAGNRLSERLVAWVVRKKQQGASP